MTDVFISYARRDREMAHALAQGLEQKGYTVWWDWDLVGGTKFRATIREAIGKSKKVIVLWSKSSVESGFVIDEADEAKKQGKLVPVSIDGSAPPFGFGDLHVIFLNDISSDLEQVLAALEQRPVPRGLISPARRLSSQSLVAAMAAVVILVVAGALYWLQDHKTGSQGKARETVPAATGMPDAWPTKRKEATATSPKASAADAAYADAISKGTETALQDFIDKYSDDPRAVQLKLTVAEQRAWKTAERVDTRSGYESYLRAYPDGVYAAAARSRIQELLRSEFAERPRVETPPPAPQPPPTFQPRVTSPSFNCLTDRDPDEQTICTSSELARLDVELSDLYTALRGRLGRSGKNQLRNQQRAWLKTRSRCQWDAQCIRNLYLSRIQQLRGWFQ